MPIKITTLNDMVAVLLPIGQMATMHQEAMKFIGHFRIFGHGCLITVPFVSIGIVVNEVKKAGRIKHHHCT